MPTQPTPSRARQSRRPLWYALAVILALIAWWELAAPRQPTSLPAEVSLPLGYQVAVFAGGCFWCTEADFDKLPGVWSTTSGYTGGHTANPSYAEVSSQATGHVEAVKIVFDPSKISYPQLLNHYWHSIDPTVRDRQFCGIGSSYRAVIFVTDAAQLRLAQESRDALEKSKPFKEPIVTEIRNADDFYAAEEAHQNYHQNNPVRYEYYRSSCGRDARLRSLWGDLAGQ